MRERYLQSIGMSCQTRHQIERFAGTEAARAAGLALRIGPFDWLGAPPLRVAAYLDAGLPAHEFEAVIERNARAFLAGPGFHAVHGYRVREADGTRRLDIRGDLRAGTRDARPSAAEVPFHRPGADLLRPRELPEQYRRRPVRSRRDWRNTASTAPRSTSCRRASIACSQRPANCSSSPGRTVSTATPSADGRVRLLAPDTTEWKGDDAQWNEVLADQSRPEGSRTARGRRAGLGRLASISNILQHRYI